jgi:hypothetical protein
MSTMIAGAAFDLDAAQFGIGDVAHVCGVSRAVIDMWGNRGFIGPSRRARSIQPMKGGRSKPSKGRPLFSARDLFEARLLRVLATRVGLAVGESEDVSEKARKYKIPTGTDALAALAHALAELAQASDPPEMKGEWMWAIARSIERGKRFYVYAYATRSDDQWLFDMHFVTPGEPPCFGLDLPHIFIPVSDVFEFVYSECKKLLGIEMDAKGSAG